MAESPHRRPAVQIRLQDGTLVIVVDRQFDYLRSNVDWAQEVLAAWPGPYIRISIDVSSTGLLSSTFFAGAIHLQAAYAARGAKETELYHPDPRLVRNLKMLRVDHLFSIVDRPEVDTNQIKRPTLDDDIGQDEGATDQR